MMLTERSGGGNGVSGLLTASRRPVYSASETLTGVVPEPATAGEALRWMRNAVRLSQRDAARRAGIADGLVSEFENDLQAAKAEQYEALAGALLLEMATLLEGFAVVIREIHRRREAA